MAVDRLNVTCSRGSIRRESRVGIWHQEDRREQRAPSEVLRQQGGGDPALAQGAGSGREGRCGRAGGRVPGDRRFLSLILIDKCVHDVRSESDKEEQQRPLATDTHRVGDTSTSVRSLTPSHTLTFTPPAAHSPPHSLTHTHAHAHAHSKRFILMNVL